jgi:hypothetical protein
VAAVLYRYRAGVSWRNLPAWFDDWKNVHQCLRFRYEYDVIEWIFRDLAAGHNSEYMTIASMIVRAHQHSIGTLKKGRRSSHRMPFGG